MIVLVVFLTGGSNTTGGGNSLLYGVACAGAEQKGVKRIVSLAPSITETLFALGLGENVVGVTNYCKYPPEVAEKKKTGGYYDTNYEAIMYLKPDLVMLLSVNTKAERYLKKIKIKTLSVDQSNVQGILKSVFVIGAECGVEARAREIVRKLQYRINLVSEKTKSLKHRSVLVVVGKKVSSKCFKEVCVAGEGTFLGELICLAGGVNACRGLNLPYPVVSAEGLLRLQPDVIIDIAPETGSNNDALKEKYYRQWRSFTALKAVKNNSVHIVSDDFAAVPGPRFILFLEQMQQMVHPEAGVSINEQ